MSTVSNVNLFTAIVVVVILLVVIYLAFVPTPQSVWKIENSKVYNLHLSSLMKHEDSVPDGIEVMESVSGPAMEAGSGTIPSHDTMTIGKHELSNLFDGEHVLRKHHSNDVTMNSNTVKDLISQFSSGIQDENLQFQEEESNYKTVGYTTTKRDLISNELLVVKLPKGTNRDESLQKQNSDHTLMNNTSMNDTKPDDDRQDISQAKLLSKIPTVFAYNYNRTFSATDSPAVNSQSTEFHLSVWQHSVSVWSNKTQCRDNICSEYLSRDDRMRYLSCLSSIQIRRAKPKDGVCHFIDGSHRPAVALVSFPGSGNTWVRGILEVATGVCTGAIYCDISLRAQGFTGERIQSGSVLVVKTHSSAATWLGSHFNKRTAYFGSAIFIVRNPLDALVAEWNRKVANNFHGRTVYLESHTKSAGKEWFGKNKRWISYVYAQMNRWVAMLTNWVVLRNKHPVLLVKYENLKQNMLAEVKRMLRFLKVDFIEEEVERRMIAGFSAFKRNHIGMDFDPYTPDLRQYVQSKVNASIHLLEEHNLGRLIQMQDYTL